MLFFIVILIRLFAMDFLMRPSLEHACAETKMLDKSPARMTAAFIEWSWGK